MKYLRAVLYALIPAIPLLGLPLLGWGFDDLRGFFSVYPRLGYGFLLGALTLANMYQAIEVPEVNNSRQGEAGKRVRRQSAVVVGMLLLLFLTLLFLPFTDRRSMGVIKAGQAVRWLGLVLCAFGIALGFWSRITLGRMYSSEITIQKSHQLIKAGPYRVIRHPVYLGIICFFLGLSLLFRSWIGLAVMLPTLVGLVFRINDEERILQKEFGQEWEAYRNRSWRLVPYLY